MGPLALRRRMTRVSHRRAAYAVAVLVAGTIALHHGALALSMDMHHGAHGAVVEFCLGVLTAVGTAAAVIAIGFLPGLHRRPPQVRLWSAAAIVATVLIPRARPGPQVLNELCVSRR